MIPISKNIIEPQTINACLYFVDSIEQFEAIEIFSNQAIIGFDNNRQCFYEKERDKYGEYSKTKIYFYEDFYQKSQSISEKEFIERCKLAGLNELKIKFACLFFLQNKTPEQVWEWCMQNNINYEWDSLKTIKYRIKKILFPELVKKVNKK